MTQPMTKRELREQARRERKAREAALERRQKTRRLGLWVALPLVAVAVVAIAGYFLFFSSTSSTSSVPLVVGQQVPDEGRTHVPEGTAIDYQAHPPASGSHYPVWSTYGLHEEPVAAGYWVHNLEHGSVVILYNCPSDCADLKSRLKNDFATFPKDKYGDVKLVIVPDQSIAPNQVVTLAWDYKLELPTYDRDQLLGFYNAHVDRGPEDIR